jgi:hypothetical protein
MGLQLLVFGFPYFFKQTWVANASVRPKICAFDWMSVLSLGEGFYDSAWAWKPRAQARQNDSWSFCA